jgi:hypothetical protein
LRPHGGVLLSMRRAPRRISSRRPPRRHPHGRAGLRTAIARPARGRARGEDRDRCSIVAAAADWRGLCELDGHERRRRRRRRQRRVRRRPEGPSDLSIGRAQMRGLSCSAWGRNRTTDTGVFRPRSELAKAAEYGRTARPEQGRCSRVAAVGRGTRAAGLLVQRRLVRWRPVRYQRLAYRRGPSFAVRGTWSGRGDACRPLVFVTRPLAVSSRVEVRRSVGPHEGRAGGGRTSRFELRRRARLAHAPTIRMRDHGRPSRRRPAPPE